jgi:hypothetical protein
LPLGIEQKIQDIALGAIASQAEKG